MATGEAVVDRRDGLVLPYSVPTTKLLKDKT